MPMFRPYAEFASSLTSPELLVPLGSRSPCSSCACRRPYFQRRERIVHVILGERGKLMIVGAHLVTHRGVQRSRECGGAVEDDLVALHVVDAPPGKKAAPVQARANLDL